MSSRVGRNARKTVKDIKVPMAGHKFDCKDLVKIIEFLHRLRRNTERDDIKESL